MIKEIFISDTFNNLLVGNTYQFSLAEQDKFICKNDGFTNKKECCRACDKCYKTSSIKINDVVLTILFQELDPFSAIRFLIDLKTVLEKKIMKITSDTVKKNYFLLLEILKTPETTFLLQEKEALFQLKNNIFVDFVQNVHCVIRNGNVLLNKCYGDVFISEHSQLDQYLYNFIKFKGASDESVSLDGNDQIEFVFKKEKEVQFKTPYPHEDAGNRVLITAEDLGNRSIMSFSFENTFIYFRLNKKGNKYSFVSEYKGKFKLIEIKIPLGCKAYSANANISSGEFSFDQKNGDAYWRFKEKKFEKETIELDAKWLDEEEPESKGLQISFKIEQENLPIQLISCRNQINNKQAFWSRSMTQSLRYEIQNIENDI
ncbi:hypothetical protein GINT2_001795 [Glugoides intestinalis]